MADKRVPNIIVSHCGKVILYLQDKNGSNNVSGLCCDLVVRNSGVLQVTPETKLHICDIDARATTFPIQENMIPGMVFEAYLAPNR